MGPKIQGDLGGYESHPPDNHWISTIIISTSGRRWGSGLPESPSAPPPWIFLRLPAGKRSPTPTASPTPTGECISSALIQNVGHRNKWKKGKRDSQPDLLEFPPRERMPEKITGQNCIVHAVLHRLQYNVCFKLRCANQGITMFDGCSPNFIP